MKYKKVGGDTDKSVSKDWSVINDNIFKLWKESLKGRENWAKEQERTRILKELKLKRHEIVDVLKDKYVVANLQKNGGWIRWTDLEEALKKRIEAIE